MTFTIDITIFGTTIAEDVELSERNTAFVAILLGLLIRFFIININSRKEGMHVLDAFFGEGFTNVFKGDMTYFTEVIKRLIRFEGFLAELLISLVTSYFFPLIAPDLESFKDLQEFLFKALTVGYSANIMLTKASEMIREFRNNFKISAAIADLFEED